MKSESKHYILGYDPGGNDDHGIAVLEVRNTDGDWRAQHLSVTVAGVIVDVDKIVGDGHIVAAGIDTLTAWSMGKSGLRPADERLRRKYTSVAKSIDYPNHINGSMCLSGALILRWLSQRADRGGLITETHPKVCFHALWKQNHRHPWAAVSEDINRPPLANKEEAKRMLLNMLGIVQDFNIDDFGDDDHRFDALLGCLAAFEGLNKRWLTDLHAPSQPDVIHPFGQTHYWWPEDVPPLNKKPQRILPHQPSMENYERKSLQL